MSEYLRVARLYMVLLAIFTVGRWAQSLSGVAYERAHQVFSIVTLTFLASAFYGAFCRRWRGYRLPQAMIVGALFGLMAQLVIFLSTVASYGAGMNTFFNHPTALNVPAAIPLSEALPRRLGGLVFGPLSNGIAGALGWMLGALLPESSAQPVSRDVRAA